mgnify:CR=1 FL=1
MGQLKIAGVSRYWQRVGHRVPEHQQPQIDLYNAQGTFQQVVQKRWKPIEEFADRYKDEIKEVKDRYKNEGLMEQVEVPTYRWAPAKNKE